MKHVAFLYCLISGSLYCSEQYCFNNIYDNFCIMLFEHSTIINKYPYIAVNIAIQTTTQQSILQLKGYVDDFLSQRDFEQILNKALHEKNIEKNSCSINLAQRIFAFKSLASYQLYQECNFHKKLNNQGLIDIIFNFTNYVSGKEIVSNTTLSKNLHY